MSVGGFRGETAHNSLRKDNIYLYAKHVHAYTPLRNPNVPNGRLKTLGTTAMTDIGHKIRSSDHWQRQAPSFIVIGAALLLSN